MAFVARLKIGWVHLLALILLAGCASTPATSQSVTVRRLDDDCGATLRSERGLATFSEWVGDTLEVTYFAIHDDVFIPSTARIDALSPSAIRLSYQYSPQPANAPMDMCGPVALRFTVRGVPRAQYAVEVLSQGAER